jgi:hypothetical protein
MFFAIGFVITKNQATARCSIRIEDCQESRQKPLRGIMVHLDNARLHNDRKSEAILTATKARRIPASTYSPDLSPSDFFLFGMLEERMSGTSFSPSDELISAISELIASFPKDQLGTIYKNWMKRLNWAIKHWREYHRK